MYFTGNRNSGFTLIELLVVIAIIAILVAIVVVAINPAQRLKEALDRAAASNVRSTGTLIGVCVTNKLSQNPPLPLVECGAVGGLDVVGNKPTDVLLGAGAGDVCAAEQGSPGGGGTHYIFRFSTGAVEPIGGILDTAGPPYIWCT